MHPTLLANTWMAAHLPGERDMALLCCAGSAGEAAFRNSFDTTFAEAGYQHLPTTLNRTRPTTYYVIRTTLGEGEVTTHHTARSPQSIANLFASSNTPLLRRAQIFSNATTMEYEVAATEVDMSCMGSVASVPSGFMSGCTTLASVQLPPNLEVIGNDVLCNCPNLIEIDLSGMKKLRRLGGWKPCLSGCTSLTSVLFPPNLKGVGYDVLSGCTSLTQVDMSSLVGTRALGDGFMSGCTSLTSVLLPPNVREVGDRVFSGCTRLPSSALPPNIGAEKPSPASSLA